MFLIEQRHDRKGSCSVNTWKLVTIVRIGAV